MEITIAIIGVLIGIIQTFIAMRQYNEAAKAREQEKKAKSERDVYKRASESYLKLFAESDDVFENVDAALSKISDIISNELILSDNIEMLNLGLDLEVVMPWLVNLVKSKETSVNLTYKGLIINPAYEKIKPLIDGTSNIHQAYVEAALVKAESIADMRLSRLVLEIRSYSTLPHFHGFIINKKHLFIGFTEIENGKLIGGTYPYIYLLRNEKMRFSRHLFHVFNTWFEYTWENSIVKINIKKV